MTKPNTSNARLEPQRVLISSGHQGRLVQDALFFGLVFWFLWQCVDPRLLYHGGGEIQVFPAFRWGQDYFHEFWPYEGGLARYLAALLAQFLFDAWPGALLLTLQAWLVYAFTRAFLRALDAEHLWGACFVPPLLLLVLHSWYTYCFGTVTNLLLGLGAVCLYLRCTFAKPWMRLALISGLAGVLYALAGSGFDVFVALVAVFELDKGRWPLALLAIPLAVVLPIAEGRMVFGLNPAESFDGLRPFGWKIDTTLYREMILVYALYVYLPLLSLGLVLWRGATRRFLSKGSPTAPVKKPLPASPGRTSVTNPADVQSGQRNAKASESRPPARTRSRHFELMIETAGVLLVTGGILWMTFDRNLKAVLAVDYYATHRMWPQVLAAARGNPRNVYVVSAVDRALFHSGMLGRDLPLFQSPDNLLLLEEDVRAHWNKIDLYLDLGCVNMALHHLAEALAFYGERPYLLRRLALVNLALGNTATARIYLRSLARTPFHGGWASEYLRRIDLDPTLSQDAEVMRLRSLMPAQDELVPTPPEQMLSGLLEAHATNRMAAEYLICYALLSKDLAALAKNLDRLDAAGLADRPMLYDEAGLLVNRRRPKLPNWSGRLPRPETQKRFERFVEMAKRLGGKPMASSEALAQEFGTSYFFYFYSQP